MKKLGLILSQIIPLLGFCFKNLDFSATQLAHFDICLINLFVIITFLNWYHYLFYSLSNKFACFIMRAVFYKQHTLEVLILLNDLIGILILIFFFEILSIKNPLDDFLMWLCLLYMTLKILRLSPSELFLTNSQPSCSSMAFHLFIS